MAKDYGRKKYSVRRRGRVSGPLLLALVCYLLGYLSASVFDLTSLTGWINAQVAKRTGQVLVKPALQKAELPKPKFEFYTLLTNDNRPANPVVTASSPTSTMEVAVAASSIAPIPIKSAPRAIAATASLPQAAAKGSYFVQIAAFRRRDEAERMKAKLAFKGIFVTIVSVNQPNVSWYRVSVGPFSSRTEAEKAQVAVAQAQHIVGIIRKMDA